MRKYFFISISSLFIGLGLAGFQPVYAQFIHFQMSVEPELSANVVQDLNFGEFMTNSGTQQIEKGSPGMGIFEIRGLGNQYVAVTLNSPEALRHSNRDISEEIPVALEASFTNGNVQNVEEAQPFIGSKTWFTIGGQANPSIDNQTWESAFVYIYGSLEIGDVPDGTYDATLVLTVEYH